MYEHCCYLCKYSLVENGLWKMKDSITISSNGHIVHMCLKCFNVSAPAELIELLHTNKEPKDKERLIEAIIDASNQIIRQLQKCK